MNDILRNGDIGAPGNSGQFAGRRNTAAPDTVALADPASPTYRASVALDAIAHAGVYDVDSEAQRNIVAFTEQPTHERWEEIRSVGMNRTITLWGVVNQDGDQVAGNETPTPAVVAAALERVADDHDYRAAYPSDESHFELVKGCVCGTCTTGCAARLNFACCGACVR